MPSLRTSKPAPELTPQQQKDALYAAHAASLRDDPATPEALRHLALDPRVTVRRPGPLATGPGGKARGRCVVYWMQRAQRGRDNPALDLAVTLGNAFALPVVAFFHGMGNFPSANLRSFAFLNRGLVDAAEHCRERNVGFVLRTSAADTGNDERLAFFAEVGAAMVVSDENPLRAPESWRVDLAERLDVPFWTVDADVIVPSKLLGKAQFSAGVARPRLYRALPEFLHPHENPVADVPWKMPRGLHHQDPRRDMTQGWTRLDRSVKPVEAWTGGYTAGMQRLARFCAQQLKSYERDRNHPELDGTSQMSPYLHYGHLSPVTVALAVEKAAREHRLPSARDAYFNELVAWRELSVNFVRYQPAYDSVDCADNWARLTIARHDRDRRERLYTRAELEAGRTHDELWNAAQLQMVRGGWMHNFMRMYWGKKVVEWTPDARTAMEMLVYLNDKYELDGRDPGGYAGIAWSVLGKFDRAWGERPVFGKRRCMTYESTRRKFDAACFRDQVAHLPG